MSELQPTRRAALVTAAAAASAAPSVWRCGGRL